MNEAMNNLLTRRSCRKYKPDMLPQEVLDEILRAGTYAASGHGTQNPIMIAVTDKEMRDKLSKLNAKIFGKPDIDPFYGAPVVVIVLADKKYPTYVYDGSLAMGNLMLAAHALGIAGDYEGIGHCILGYADCPEPQAAPRKENRVYYIK